MTSTTQQHFVALAVTLGLARQLAEDDPAETKALLDQLASDLKDTLQELRNLAHGIYPPLLVDAGLPDALRAAAGRSPLRTVVEVDGVGRHPPDVEAAHLLLLPAGACRTPPSTPGRTP